jgi:hypothetical protein
MTQQHRMVDAPMTCFMAGRYANSTACFPDVIPTAALPRHVRLLLVKMKSQTAAADNTKSVTDCIIIQFS